MHAHDGKSRQRVLGLGLLLLVLVALPACGQEKPDAPADDVFAKVRAQILPNADEVAWERIDWQVSYTDGLRAAAKAQKPLLLWVMNGHPLGCT